MPGEARFDAGNLYRKWERNLDDPSKALTILGLLMESSSQKAFDMQEFGGKKWDERGEVNVFGVIADFAKLKKTKPFARRFQTRPALVDSKRLSGSFKSKLVGTHVIELGLPEDVAKYAEVLHTGGKIESETLTKEVQQKIVSWLMTQDDDRYVKFFAKAISPAMTGKKLEGEVVARPMVGITEENIADITEIIQTELLGN